MRPKFTTKTPIIHQPQIEKKEKDFDFLAQYLRSVADQLAALTTDHAGNMESILERVSERYHGAKPRAVYVINANITHHVDAPGYDREYCYLLDFGKTGEILAVASHLKTPDATAPEEVHYCFIGVKCGCGKPDHNCWEMRQGHFGTQVEMEEEPAPAQ